MKKDRLSSAPVFVKNLRAVLRSDSAHRLVPMLSDVLRSPPAQQHWSIVQDVLACPPIGAKVANDLNGDISTSPPRPLGRRRRQTVDPRFGRIATRISAIEAQTVTWPAHSRQLAHARRGAADRGEHRQAAGAAAGGAAKDTAQLMLMRRSFA